ncbi:sigma-70 family RNA polymerase sigma factor [Streptomyces sp. DSM 44917]|uniref:Sigma-70 family RNA polymerase sigma factor n=1 Tax=Streptomyces boetiae TaxID=3075541 RepID=A0ABU2LBN7_9ACTN|nr:sigma-70 family RNA polymerase sigma factor [Streptomyces sp. DSM 44917]MDT0308910.1 sigma-70 family RNA polymerase sigma factor [Streptomyces sp. DSM 44917]
MSTRSRDRSSTTAPTPARPRSARSSSRRSARTGQARRPYEDAHLDGLFTYCLSVMCEHDAATAALGEALALAERQDERGRRPADPAAQRAWLYALARWACLRRLAARGGRDEPPAAPLAADEEDARRRRRELAALSWAEAAGTTPEQREALELAVRHQLTAAEVAQVLRLSGQAAQELLTGAAREVDRTRAALAAVDAAGCPAAAALAGDDRRLLLGPSLRGELLLHVEQCPTCRLIARRAQAGGGAPGTPFAGSSRLTVLAAPRPAVHAARLAIRRARAQHTPRYDRAGFPVADRDRAASRARLRSRAVTTTVVATVIAAPVLALWAAWREAPAVGEGTGADGAAAAAQDDAGYDPDGGTGEYPYEPAGRAGSGGEGAGGEARDEREGAGAREREPEGAASAAPGQAAQGGSQGGSGGGSAPSSAPGRLTADAVPTDTGTRITLVASGGAPVDWTASADVAWLSLSRSSGTLRPGEMAVIEARVDPEGEPAGPWQARITIEPAAAVITVEGNGPEDPAPTPEPEPTRPPEEPTDPPPGGDPAPEGS